MPSGDRAFSTAAPILWNMTPTAVPENSFLNLILYIQFNNFIQENYIHRKKGKLNYD